MIQFYSPDIDTSLRLGPEESQHCVRVLRQRAGDIIFVTNGKGRRYECRILEATTKGVRVEILTSTDHGRNWNHDIVLAIAPTKNVDRISWLVEKAVEIGVDKIIFLKCEHNERKCVNLERMRRIAISAMNQSLKTILPQIVDLTSIEDLTTSKGWEQAFFGYCDIKEKRQRFVESFNPEKSVLICIGPEGDFSASEVQTMKNGGFIPVTFGDERLRTETAGIYGLSGVHILYDKNTLTKIDKL